MIDSRFIYIKSPASITAHKTGDGVDVFGNITADQLITITEGAKSLQKQELLH